MKKVLALAMVLMLAASSAWAWNDAQHVKVAPNGKGDLLIFPFYFSANGGWQTKITVINTDTSRWSTVAKVVIRSNFYSQEVRDFLLYLTPSDVWTATITNDGTKTWLESTDDSMLASNGQFASATNPAKVDIPNPKDCSVGTSNKYNVDDSSQYGYIEVIEAWYGDLDDEAYDDDYQIGERRTRPVSKSFLYRVYSNTNNPPVAPRMDATPDAADQTINILTGYMEFQNSLISGYTSSMRASVFADWDNQAHLTTADVSGIDNNAARNTLGEIEAVLAKSNLVMPYINQGAEFTVHVLTFPTKTSNFQRTQGDSYCRFIEGGSDSYELLAPYWDDPDVPGLNDYASTVYSCPTYRLGNFDLSEGATAGPYSGEGTENPLCREVNLLLSQTGFRSTGSGSIYSEGWTLYNMNRSGPTTFSIASTVADGVGTQNHTYFGSPIIPSVVMFKKGSVSLMEGAYTDGNVYGIADAADDNDFNTDTNVLNQPAYADGAWPDGGYAAGANWLPYYQYTNFLPSLGRDSY